jgi:PAS domain S-box-containing protein
MSAGTEPPGEPPEQFEGARHCVVRPDELHVLGETLQQFLDSLDIPGQSEWRGAFLASVSEIASIVLSCARPQFVHVTVWSRDESVHVMLTESGRLWLGKPEPAEVLEVLDETRRAALDSATYLSTQVSNKWTLSRRLGTAPARSRQPVETGRRRRGAPKTGVTQLTRSARRIAEAPRAARIPYLGRPDELGEMARALQTLKGVALERAVLETMIRQVPVGIAVVGPDGRYRSVNPAFAAMYGYRGPEEIVGRLAANDLDPEVAASHRSRLIEFWEGKRELLRIENRYSGPDGLVSWHGHTIAALRGPDGRPEAVIAFVQDTTERTVQEARAARIQRDLLPTTAPTMEGYELSGGCLPAQDMSGDFFDWVLHRDRQLDLTLADVMGKGMGAALVMAALRTGLRAVAPGPGPAERVRTALESLTLSGDEEGLFVTLFQARVDLDTGVVRYVDAGHGYWAVRRAGGELVHVPGSSLPLLVLPDAKLEEREIRLEPGDTLILYSDGLVEREWETMELGDYREDLDEAEDVEAMVKRLLGRAPAHLADDVTVAALRRLAGAEVREAPELLHSGR